MYRTQGLPWQRIQDKTFQRLALWRALETYPELEDVELEHDGSIECYFGSTGATITLRRIDGEALGLFLHGYCTLLAYAIHEKTGLPLVVFSSVENSQDWSGHAGVLVGDNEIVDISGRRSFENVRHEYRNVGAGVVLSKAEFVETVVSDEAYRDDPLSFVEELERYVVNDFADYIISTHC